MAGRTERLYQRDSHLTRFEARILSVGAAPGHQQRPALVLDRTAFYPEGGGQPCDTGSLSGMRVVDVQEGPDGPLHVIDDPGPGAPRPAAGDRVEGEIDWARRFDHMQQHSGQHLLSRGFLEAASARTLSFHLGAATCTIDVAMSPPDEGRIREAVRLANEVIWSDRPVEVRESEAPAPGGTAEDLSLSGLKLKPGDPIRTIVVGGFDATPCGGTHVTRTGQVGSVAVIGWEPWKRRSRIAFVCGARVVARLEESTAALDAVVAGLSAPPGEVAGALARLLAEKVSLFKQVTALNGRLAGLEAAAAAGDAPEVGGFRLLKRIFTAGERSVEAAQALVRKFVEPPGRIALVAVVDGERATFLAARSRGEGPPMGAILSEVAREAGGRGGGSPESARAGGIPAEAAEALLEAASSRLADAIGGGAR